MRAKIAVLAVAAAAIAMTATPASAVELHGYWRNGVGGNSAGGGQVCFATPGAWYKFRLGNECETYAEFELSDTIYKDKNGVQFNFHQMLAYITGVAPQTFEGIPTWALRQLWIEAKGLPFLGGASVWIGDRYYKRHDIHNIDFFYWDSSGTGFGIEDIDLGVGKLAFATFQTIDRAAANGQNAWRPDLRLSGIGLATNASLEIGVNLNILSNQSPTLGGASTFSPWFTGELALTNLLGGSNKLAVQYGMGTAWNLSAFPDFGGTSDDKQFRVVDFFQFQASDAFSGMFLVTYQDITHVADGGSRIFGIGFRPVLHMSDYFKLQLDLGLAQSKDKAAGAESNMLWKATLAPTIVAGGGYWARPELRLFATYASWNDAATASGVANGAFGNDNSGWTMGAQLEAWF